MFERHQKSAIQLYLISIIVFYIRDDIDVFLAEALLLAIGLIFILVYRVIAQYANVGWMESMASDFKKPVQPIVYAGLFWLIYLLIWSLISFRLVIPSIKNF